MFEFDTTGWNPEILVLGVGADGVRTANHLIQGNALGISIATLQASADGEPTSLAKDRFYLAATTADQPDSAAGLAPLEVAVARADLVIVVFGETAPHETAYLNTLATTMHEAEDFSIAVVVRESDWWFTNRSATVDPEVDALCVAFRSVVVIPRQEIPACQGRQYSSNTLLDDQLASCVRTITDIVTVPGLNNTDFADIRTIMHGSGLGGFGTGTARGPNRIINAARLALTNLPFSASPHKVPGSLVLTTGGPEMGIGEVNAAMSVIQDAAHPGANIVYSATVSEEMVDTIRVSLIVSGLRGSHAPSRALSESKHRILEVLRSARPKR